MSKKIIKKSTKNQIKKSNIKKIVSKKNKNVDIEEDNVEEDLEIDTDVKEEKTDSNESFRKHALKHDDIFKGKKQKKSIEEDEYDTEDDYTNDKIIIDPGLSIHEEATNNADYQRMKQLKSEVYRILLNLTNLDFSKNRRKPGPSDFNKFYAIVKNNLDVSMYSKCEIFVELCYYFSDNLYNMFKMLNKKDGAEIVKELRVYMKMNKKLDTVDFL